MSKFSSLYQLCFLIYKAKEANIILFIQTKLFAKLLNSLHSPLVAVRVSSRFVPFFLVFRKLNLGIVSSFLNSSNVDYQYLL